MPYSVIGVQEAHLATHYNPLYWACACLCCNAGSTVQDVDFDEDEGSDVQSDETPVDGSGELTEASEKKKRAAPNYGKIAKAIDDVQRSGVEIAFPDINTAGEDFIPDVKNNRIIYSLRSVNSVGDALFDEIVANRPYSSLKDFVSRVSATPAQIVGLIKAGCFDELEKENRKLTVKKYLKALAEKDIPVKDTLTAAHIKRAIASKMPLEGFQQDVWMFNFKKWIDEHQCDVSCKDRYLLTDQDAISFFNRYVKAEMNEKKDEYSYLPRNGIAVKKSAFLKVFKKKTVDLRGFFDSEEGRKKYAEHMRKLYFEELCEKFCKGSIPQWEMEQMCFYHETHELAGVAERSYGIVDFFKLPETPEYEVYVNQSGEERKSPKTCAIAGTIVHVENGRHTVWLLTTHGVVNAKFYGETFNKYKSAISRIDPKTGIKTVIDKPWLKRGEKILIYGYRREDAFVVRSSKFGGRSRTICLIEWVNPNGELSLKFARNAEEKA